MRDCVKQISLAAVPLDHEPEATKHPTGPDLTLRVNTGSAGWKWEANIGGGVLPEGF